MGGSFPNVLKSIKIILYQFTRRMRKIHPTGWFPGLPASQKLLSLYYNFAIITKKFPRILGPFRLLFQHGFSEIGNKSVVTVGIEFLHNIINSINQGE